MAERLQPAAHPFFAHPGPLAFAHRGFAPDGLENTMAAIERAVRLGYRYLETDARATRDGVVLAFHDATLSRLTGRPGRVCDVSWSDLRSARIKGAEPVATLDEVLSTWPDLRLNIDVKDVGTILPLVDVIERSRAHSRICVASFSDRRRREVVRRLSEPVATSAGVATVALFRRVARVPALVRSALRGIGCLQVPERIGVMKVVTSASVAAAHRAACQVHVWTVNEPADVHRLLDLGVDGLITDRADIIRGVLIERGEWVS